MSGFVSPEGGKLLADPHSTPASAEHVPGPYRQLMLDAHSPIRDFYPETFKTDRNGKAQEWKAVVLLSHIDPRRLQETLMPIWQKGKGWTAEERKRNKMDFDRIYVCGYEKNKKLFQRLFVQNNDPRRTDKLVSLGLLLVKAAHHSDYEFTDYWLETVCRGYVR